MEDSTKVAFRVSRISIYANFALSAAKLAAGLIAHSGAMVSDAVHSVSDVFSTFIVMIGVRLAGKESDREHPYGHERMECVAAIVLAGILLATGLMIGWQGVRKIMSPEDLQAPGALALIAALVSIGVKEAMYRYTRRAAKKIDSDALMADAWHHRSDALSSVGALVGIGGAMLGFPILDPVASLVICLFILKVAYDITKDAISKMLDTSAGSDSEQQIRAFVAAQPGVRHVDLLRTRQFGSKIYVDLEIAVKRDISLVDAHAIAESVHQSVEQRFPRVKHVMIHVNPEEDGSRMNA